MRMRIVVADRSEARFYDVVTFTGALRPAGTLTDPKAHLHERDLVSDRPGRVFDHAAPPTERRGAVAIMAPEASDPPMSMKPSPLRGRLPKHSRGARAGRAELPTPIL